MFLEGLTLALCVCVLVQTCGRRGEEVCLRLHCRKNKPEGSLLKRACWQVAGQLGDLVPSLVVWCWAGANTVGLLALCMCSGHSLPSCLLVAILSLGLLPRWL